MALPDIGHSESAPFYAILTVPTYLHESVGVDFLENNFHRLLHRLDLSAPSTISEYIFHICI